MDDCERELQGKLNALAGAPAGDRRDQVLQVLVTTLVEAFALKPDEVAVFVLSPDGEMLIFAYPPELAAGGANAFPVRFPSVAGRVVVGGKGLLSNQVQQEPHLSFYERVRVHGIAPTAIQKLLAVPLPGPASNPLGVLEISRRGGTWGEAGPDFTPEDLRRLERLAAVAAVALREATA